LFRNNVKYLENTNDYLSRTGRSKQEFLDELDAYDGSKETFLDELADTPAGGTYADFPTGAWNENIRIRGNALEDGCVLKFMPGQVQTPGNFPKIDYFDEAAELATSVKSTDLFASTYQNVSKLEELIMRYVDDLADASFPITHSGVIIGQPGVNPVSARRLHMIFPFDTPLPGQSGILEFAESYANSRGVQFTHEFLE
jgi:hypothetical protein